MGSTEVQKLETIISILKIAHRDKIDAAREEIQADKVNKAILDATSDWAPAGKLKTTVIQKTKQSKPTVERRLAALVDLGLLEREGAGSSVSYRATGLI